MNEKEGREGVSEMLWVKDRMEATASACLPTDMMTFSFGRYHFVASKGKKVTKKRALIIHAINGHITHRNYCKKCTLDGKTVKIK